MANTLGVHVLQDGKRHYIVNVNIEGDGSSSVDQVTIASVTDRSCDAFRLDDAKTYFKGFTGYLEWDGATKVRFFNIPDGDEVNQNFANHGGLTNPRVANYTGDVNLVVEGLGAGEVGTAVLHFVKKYDPNSAHL